jgi:D-3-phosphoglycerate dehydrogenase
MLAARRRIPAADASLKGGEWKRSAFKGVEVREKTLGLVGLGHVGAIVARGAIGMGMKVLAYDPYVSEDRMRSMNVQRAETTDEVFENADFVSLHVPRTPQTVGLVNAETLAKMKPTAYLINVARGGIVDEDGALRGAEKRCHRRGGARRLRGGADDGVPDLLPPQRRSHPAPGGQHRRGPGPGRHNGGRAGRDGLAGPGPMHAINAPVPVGEGAEFVAQFSGLCEVLGSLLYQLTDRPGDTLKIEYRGEVAGFDTRLLDVSAQKGLLAPMVHEPLNFVNTPILAKDRGCAWRPRGSRRAPTTRASWCCASTVGTARTW